MSTRLATHVNTDDLREREARRTPGGAERDPAPSPSPAWPAAILGLQRTAGNAAVAQLLRGAARRPVLQRESKDDEQAVGEGDPAGETASAGEVASGDGAASVGETAAAGSTDGGGGGGGGGGASVGETAAGGAGEVAGGSAGGAGEVAGGSAGGAGEVAGGSAGGAGEVAGGSAGGAGEVAGGSAGGAGEVAGGSAGGAGEVAGGSAGGAGDGGGDAGDHTPEEVARKVAEGDGVTDTDPLVPLDGGAPPYAAGGFHDGGRRAIVPFGAVEPGSVEGEEASQPHAYTGGGRTGSAAWSGGGPAGGPHGNQGSGSLQSEVAPAYDTRSNGPTSKADAWVRSGTGNVDVTRNYVSSAAGDQGNGWWISTAAASALEAHEQRHIAASSDVYGSTIKPMLDRIGESETRGKGQAYWASDAIALLARYIGWKDALAAFKEQDAQWNANQGEVDQRDFGSPGYPRNMRGPRTIGGKEYQNYLILGSEPDPK